MKCCLSYFLHIFIIEKEEKGNRNGLRNARRTHDVRSGDGQRARAAGVTARGHRERERGARSVLRYARGSGGVRVRQGAALTGVGRGGADELEGDAVVPAEDLVDAVEQRGVEVADVQHLLLHQLHRAADLALVPRLLVLPRQPVRDPVPEHGRSLAPRSSGTGKAGGGRGAARWLVGDVPPSKARQGRVMELRLPCAAIYRRPRLLLDSAALYWSLLLPAMKATATCIRKKEEQDD